MSDPTPEEPVTPNPEVIKRVEKETFKAEGKEAKLEAKEFKERKEGKVEVKEVKEGKDVKDKEKEGKEIKDKDKDKDKEFKEFKEKEVKEKDGKLEVKDKSEVKDAKDHKNEISEHKALKDHAKVEYKEYIHDGPVKRDVETPPDPRQWEQRLQNVEQAVGEIAAGHFIPPSARPDLSQGALKNEPDAGAQS